MNIKKFDGLLSNYNEKLNKISKKDIDYKITIYHAALIFFEGINKLDTDFIDFFLKNVDMENIKEKEVHRDALNCLILLIVKNSDTKDLFIRFFPEYLETEFIAQSNWRIVRWLQIFISCIFKPKPKLTNSIEARRILNVLRNMKARVGNSGNNLLLDVNEEIENYNALSLIVEKFLEKKIPPLIYIPIDEKDLLDSWNATFKSKEYLKNSNQSIASLEIDSLLKYLNHRIKSLAGSDGKKIVSSEEIISLKKLVYADNFFNFDKEINEIIKKIKDKFIHQDTFKISGIYNLIEGIKQRFKLICKASINTNFDNQHSLSSNFKEQFYFTIDKIQFYFEDYRKNLNEQNEKFFVNNTDFYNELNSLENFLYTNINLFHHTLNQTFDYTAYFRLSLSLFSLQQTVKDLENCTKDIDPKSLQNDIRKLSQFIFKEVLILQTELQKEIKSVSITNDSNQEAAIYVAGTYEEDEARIYEEIGDSDFDSEWDSDGSDISEILSLNIAQHAQALGEERPSTNLGYQSDSGISDEDSANLDQYNQSTQSTTSKFWKTRNKLADQFRLGESEVLVNPTGWLGSQRSLGW